MNIYQRMQAVMKQVAYVRKDAEVKGSGGYKAVSHDMVTALVRPHFVELGIVLHPALVSASTENTGKATSSGAPYIRYAGTYDVAFVNVDDPADRIVVHIEAHAEDTGDKAPGKAISYATKYAILKVLMLETGENDEGRVHAEPPPLSEAEEASLQLLRDAALNGTEALKKQWQTIKKEHRLVLGNELLSLKQAAHEVDAKAA